MEKLGLEWSGPMTQTTNLSGITRTDMEVEAKKNWTLFQSDVALLEIRCINPFTRAVVCRVFFRQEFPSIEAFREAIEAYAIQMNLQGYNIYINLNPALPSFNGKQLSDKDIDYRDLIFFDIDRSGTHKAPATEAELEAALDLGDTVAALLLDEGWGQPIKTCSGNGCHLYYELENIGTQQDETALIELTLKVLAKEFNTTTTEIDTVVWNASRITKFLGTIARKGEETAMRPYRLARLLS
jgi:hypothetical protein